jgi:conjugal transfer mating pair stabilization protein TraG
MIWEIYSYWNIQELYGVFEAIAMLTSTDDYSTLLGTALLFGLAGAGIAVLTGEQDLIGGFRWFLMALFLYFVLFVPKADVALIDRTGTVPAKIATNVPLSIAIFGHVSSKVGDWLTTSYETTMKVITPNYANPGVSFENNGLLFGEKVIMAAENARSENIAFRMNMTGFFEKCVFPEFDTGNISITAVLNESDMWAQLSNVNPSLFVQLYNDDGSPVASPVACDVAYNVVLPPIIANASAEVTSRMAGKLYPDQTTAVGNASLQAAMTGSYNYYLNVAASSTDIIKQQILSNTFFDASADQATVTASAMTESGAKLNYGVLYNVAQNTIPKLRNVIEVIIYAVFPIILLMMIVGGTKGVAVIKAYFISLMWIQLWAPLYAVMNYLVSSYNVKEMMARVNSGSELSAWHSSALQEQILGSADIAGMLAVSIPMIAYALIKGGQMAMTSFVSGATRPMESNAGMSSREVANGNMSLGNTSMDNTSSNTHSANKYDNQPMVNNGGPMSTGADNMTHSTNTWADGSHSTVTDSTKAEQKGASANHMVALSNEQKAQTAYSKSESAVNQDSQEAAYGAVSTANSAMGQTKGFDISKAAALSQSVTDKEAATSGVATSQVATDKLENTDQFTRSEALKVSAYAQSEIAGGASIGAIFDTGWSVKAGVKLDAAGEQKATEVLQSSYANTSQTEAKEGLALQNEIATSQELRGQMGVSDRTEESISGATQKQSGNLEKLKASLDTKEEASASLTEAHGRTETASLNTAAMLGNEAYSGEALSSWVGGKGNALVNQLAQAEKGGNENEISNLQAQASSAFQDYNSANSRVAGGVVGGGPDMPGLNPTDVGSVRDTHQSNVAEQAPVVANNEDRTGVAGIQAGVNAQNQGRDGAFDTTAESINGNREFEQQWNNGVLQPDLTPTQNDLKAPATGLSPDELRNANPAPEGNENSPYATSEEMNSSWYSGAFKQGH